MYASKLQVQKKIFKATPLVVLESSLEMFNNTKLNLSFTVIYNLGGIYNSNFNSSIAEKI